MPNCLPISTIARTHALLGVAACLLLVGAIHRAGAAESKRVEKGLRVLYDFQNTDGAMVMDRSGVDKPLNLRITNTKSVRRANGA